MQRSIFKSPVFWGGVGLLATGVGYAVYQKRERLLGREKAGPEPVLVVRNPAKMPVPTETQTHGGMTARRFDMKKMSIDERLRLIQRNVWQGIHDGRIRQLAGQLTKHCGRDEGPCEVQAIFNGVRKHVRYSGDIGEVLNPNTGEVEAIDAYSTPWRTWQAQVADCDDHSALIASLLAWLGHNVRLRVSAPSKFSDFAHIYPVVGEPKVGPRRWRAVDVTLPWRNSNVGSEAKYGRARDYVVEVPA